MSANLTRASGAVWARIAGHGKDERQRGVPRRPRVAGQGPGRRLHPRPHRQPHLLAEPGGYPYARVPPDRLRPSGPRRERQAAEGLQPRDPCPGRERAPGSLQSQARGDHRALPGCEDRPPLRGPLPQAGQQADPRGWRPRHPGGGAGFHPPRRQPPRDRVPVYGCLPPDAAGSADVPGALERLPRALLPLRRRGPPLWCRPLQGLETGDRRGDREPREGAALGPPPPGQVPHPDLAIPRRAPDGHGLPDDPGGGGGHGPRDPEIQASRRPEDQPLHGPAREEPEDPPGDPQVPRIVSWPPEYDDRYLPAPGSRYWFRDRECQDPEARDGEIIRKIQATMAWAWERAPFYRRKWQGAGLEPGDIKGLDDFSKVPVVTKQELREDQAADPPLGSYLCIPREEVRRIHGTSGTTGKPTAFAIGRDDWRRIANAHARIMWGFGLRPSDTVFFGSFFSLYLGGWGALAGVERLGATAFPFGAGVPGQTLMALRWLREMRPSAFYGTPSYGLYVAEKARQEGIDPREFGLRILFFSGEPGAGIPSTKRRIEEAYDGVCVDTSSMAEMTPWMTNAECEVRSGMHLWQDIVYTELLHPERQTLVGFGEEGVPVYTHLERASQPMIRLWSGDLATWTDEPCECGRTYPRLPRGIYGRVDDMFIVRGENVYPSAVEEVLRASRGCGEEYR